MCDLRCHHTKAGRARRTPKAPRVCGRTDANFHAGGGIVKAPGVELVAGWGAALPKELGPFLFADACRHREKGREHDRGHQRTHVCLHRRRARPTGTCAAGASTPHTTRATTHTNLINIWCFVFCLAWPRVLSLRGRRKKVPAGAGRKGQCPRARGTQTRLCRFWGRAGPGGGPHVGRSTRTDCTHMNVHHFRKYNKNSDDPVLCPCPQACRQPCLRAAARANTGAGGPRARDTGANTCSM